jgi:diaminohydroxyphosphoribosylaminopyrimidine deaminase/5-amino-6-(5-phosphoribosylamino)uracil reductase
MAARLHLKDHEKHMMRCIELARQAEGRTSPNPIVGAIVLDQNGEVVGEGFHERSGRPHAEVNALDQAGSRAGGGTLYTNLEPCSHFGKTPPCADKVIASGIKHVVAGIMDPNPLVAGKGFKKLEHAGITVISGIYIDDCNWINRGFIKRVTTNLPWVCLKMAATLDGRIADRHGQSRWITGHQAKAYVHSLRNMFDCVMVGGATAKLDDPQLNVREVPNSRDPLRALIDSRHGSPQDLRIFASGLNNKTIVFCGNDVHQERRNHYPSHVEVVPVPRHGDELDLHEALAHLAKEGCNTILCEGGSRLAASLLKAKLVDEINWLVAPKILSDAKSVPVLNSMQEVDLKDAVRLHKLRTVRLGEDVLIQALVKET